MNREARHSNRRSPLQRGNTWQILALGPAVLLLSTAQEVAARTAPATPEGPSLATTPPAMLRTGTPTPLPSPARPQPNTPAQPGELQRIEESQTDTEKKRRRVRPDDRRGAPPAELERSEAHGASHAEPPASEPPSHPHPAAVLHGEDEEEPFDPNVRQNVAGTPVSPEWDAEKIINTDRPDFTDVLPTVGKGVWQTESGLSLKMRRSEEYGFNRWAVPETFLRLGLTRRFELRVKWDAYWFTDRTGTARSVGASYGSTMIVGFKWQAVPQAGWVPGHTFLGTLSYHAGTGRGPAQTAIQPGVNWVYGWQMNKWLVLRGSTGFEVTVRHPQAQPAGDMTPTYDLPTRQTFVELHQSVVSYVQILKRLGMYYEWFGFWYYGQERGVQHNGGVGAYIYLTPNIQLDVRYGGTIAGPVRETFTGVGVSFRGRYNKKKGPRAMMR